MRAILFYITYPFIYAIASLPFWLLYKVSDFLCPILYRIGYRKEIVKSNLRNSFPDKSLPEIEAIAKSYYRYLCDLVLETLKTLRMTEEESRARCTFHNTEYLDSLFEAKKSFIIVMGHYGNWEWAGPAFTLNTRFQLMVIYRPLSDPYFDKMMSGMRTKFGTRIATVNQTLREMVTNRSKGLITATAFIADQTAPRDHAYWTTFLNQDTAVFTGPEKLAVKFNYPVVYMNIQRPRRGHYEVFPELLFASSHDTAEGEISEAFTKRLEREIILDPTLWLWSHRRWKHQRGNLSEG